MRVSRPLLGAATAALALPSAAPAGAGGLQVAPVSITVAQDERADGLTLSNMGDSAVHAQVRVYRWSQDRNGDALDPTGALAISPPMVSLEPGGQQLVRVIRTGPPPPPGSAEDSYRIVIDELPVETEAGGGLKFVLRYSLPVFVEPARAASPPKLDWKLVNEDGKLAVQVTNSGGMHAQIADVSLRTADGRQTQLAPGLLGYALPGATRLWATAEAWPEPGPEGSLQVRVNGQESRQPLPPSAPRH